MLSQPQTLRHLNSVAKSVAVLELRLPDASRAQMDLRMKLLATALVFFAAVQAKAEPLLIAPMLEGLHMCLAAVAAGQVLDQVSSEATCARSGQSAAPFIRDLLDG